MVEWNCWKPKTNFIILSFLRGKPRENNQNRMRKNFNSSEKGYLQ